MPVETGARNMLLYFQPVVSAEERRCFLIDPLFQRGPSDCNTETISMACPPQEAAPSICVHLFPSVISIFLSRE
jgi:hypothetical protein